MVFKEENCNFKFVFNFFAVRMHNVARWVPREEGSFSKPSAAASLPSGSLPPGEPVP